MRRGKHRVQFVIVGGHDGSLTKLNEVVEAMGGDARMVNVKLKNGEAHTFNGRVHADGERVVLSSVSQIGQKATITEDRRGRLRLQVS